MVNSKCCCLLVLVIVGIVLYDAWQKEVRWGQPTENNAPWGSPPSSDNSSGNFWGFFGEGQGGNSNDPVKTITVSLPGDAPFNWFNVGSAAQGTAVDANYPRTLSVGPKLYETTGFASAIPQTSIYNASVGTQLKVSYIYNWTSVDVYFNVPNATSSTITVEEATLLPNSATYWRVIYRDGGVLHEILL